ncbi:ester cyclase [Amycolatopsis sp. OK19-0408]|uniref:Ester cyclase n=1 Tax=Amycolatopsis iheyensis TaxID=2945988 RepID=A0A9X2SLS5_9PSEU|nr:ester cyclase [Amycolatopsis iheyensis]MCR6484900.1 ester cyclase [Amycolatopsis iheyensis]
MTDLEARYRAYLACLDERRFPDLADHVHDPVVHNDRALTLADFQDLLRRDVAEIPDLRYVVELLVVQGERVACRLRFDCTPVGRFRGIPATGKAISFAEHVFYRYRDGKIAEIRSLIDLEAVREQLTP